MTIPVGAKFIKGFVADEGLMDAVDVDLVTTSFRRNLQTSDSNLQLLAEALDSLNITPSGHDADLTALQTKVELLYQLANVVDKLHDLGDNYDPTVATEVVTILQGYSLIADFRATNDRYESTGVTYSKATDVVRYTGLSNSLDRCFGVKVSAPSAQTLVWLDTAADRIPFIDMTAAGNYRINNYTPARTSSEAVTNHLTALTRTGGTEVVSTAEGSVSTWTVPDFPTGATNLNRTVQVGIDVFVNGADTQGEHLDTISIVPNTAEAQALRTATATINLGPLHGNRRVTVTYGYEFRAVGGTLFLDLTLETAPSDVTVTFRDVFKNENYTQATTIARVDDWLTLQDIGGDYTFTGADELLLTFHPHVTHDGLTLVVPVARDDSAQVSQLNDVLITIPTVGFDEIEVPDTVEFRTFLPPGYLNHIDLVHKVDDTGVKWAYGTARLDAVTSRAFTAAIDLAAGSTLGGAAFVQPESVVYEATGTGTSAGELVSSVQLPTNYGNFKYVHITEYDVTNLQWRHAEIPTVIFTGGHVDANDAVRLQGNTTMGWTAGTRTLTMTGNVQEIFRVSLKD